MLVYCPFCQNISKSQWVHHSGSEAIMSGVQTDCAVCGSPYAFFLDGHFKFDASGALELLSGPQFTIDAVQRFADYMRTIQVQKIPITKAQEEIVKKHPAFIDFFNKFLLPKSAGDFYAFLAVVIPFFTWLGERKAPEQAPPEPIIHEHFVQPPLPPTIREVHHYHPQRPEAPKGSNHTPAKKKRKRRK